ncbi:MAG: hypothetical protein MK213_00725 [Planctomycetes bacterium]|nr:hypothetical protein [Planctomycetota bacterium]
MLSCVQQAAQVEGDGPSPETLALLALEASTSATLLMESSSFAAVDSFIGASDPVAVTFSLRNPLGLPVRLLEIFGPEGRGVLFDFSFRETLWFPEGGKDGRQWRRLAFEEELTIAPGSSHAWNWELQPEHFPSEAALRISEVSLNLRCGGLELGDRELPVHFLKMGSVRVVSLPPGWHHIAAAPLESLRKAAQMGSEQADRHVLVASALLPKSQKWAGVECLIEALDESPNRERLRTLKAGLQYLTGLQFPNRKAWQKWWGQSQNRNP